MNILLSLRRRWALSLTIAVVLALLALLAWPLLTRHDPRELPSVLIGKSWPDMALPQLGSAAAGGEPVGPAQLRGKARLVNVWASWCAVCVEEQPVLMALGETLRKQGRADQLIGLSYKDKPADATAWLRRYGNPFATVLVDADGRMGIELGVYGAPESYLIDAQGIIVWKHVGELTPEVVAKEVLPRLGAQS
ncbi:MAG: DsbE family thiol:disulfide interchange protein [Desulfovibrionaceae bacterium]|jgi:cytochrome c biogenesis protein CcmG/thiol:disulfide interchange protein DsbE|nr:DsbE family thiol:disulfide interchange protein [Desulfovibrionaceae bacterium]